MRLHDYITSLAIEERDPFAKRCGTSLGFLKLIAYGRKPCSPELAVAIDRETSGAVCCEELCPPPKMDWAYLRQRLSAAASNSAQFSQSASQ
jgi:DNA-binding transcriptional regulator YdaS (Cro superfamily)